MIEINMQMPEKCCSCPCFHAENPMYCQAVKADKNKKIVAPYGLPRPEWCPLKDHEDLKQKMWNALYAEEDKLEKKFVGTEELQDNWFYRYRPWLQKGFEIAIKVIAEQDGM